MNDRNSVDISRACWFVGASFGHTQDQVARFLSEGIWEVRDPGDKDRAQVNSMKVGDRIAIKATYVRKNELPFDNRGQAVSVMAIKATGTVTENLQDGERVRVALTAVDPAREWYFYTYRATIWRVLPGDWKADGLIAFTLDNKPQDIERFRNDPFWQERFGSVAPDQRRFAWTKFYAAVADKLLPYRHDRRGLVNGIRDISSRVEGLGHLSEDQYADGTKGFVKDICPFTTMGLFNRGIKDSNRKIIATELARFLGVVEPVPATFEGIPLLNNLKSWYFPFEKDRAPDHIDALWDVFTSGLQFSEPDEGDAREDFMKAFDGANGRPGVAWNLTFGLYWVRPWTFISLDNNSRAYVGTKLGIQIARSGPKRRCSGADYLALMDTLEPRFQEAAYPVHSFPELSLQAWIYNDRTGEPSSGDGLGATAGSEDDDDSDDLVTEAIRPAPPIVSYGIDDIVKDGCFLAREEIERMLDRLRDKKNLILQGPPGTGKTWLAKRLAFAWMGQKDDSKVRAVQFHPNLSYEDFVRGWRPTGEGKLSLVDGVFMQAIKAASKEPLSKFVVVIEEINRGNPAQIFGELLTLLEAGKRTPSEALELCYPDADGQRRPVHIPDNLYVIGTMNIADRSLALVDLALRRRFAFVDLEPKLGSVWRQWVVSECSVAPNLIADIERRISELNQQIASDPALGRQFRIGHSYVTPSHRIEPDETKKWFRQVILTEVGPLLDEYWFDAPDVAEKVRGRLLEGW